MSSISDELDLMLGRLQNMEIPVVQFLVPGVPGDRVRSVLGVDAPTSVVEWFGWRNGVRGFQGKIQDDVNIIPGYNLVSIEEAVSLKSHYIDDPVLGENWIPLLESPGGDLYAAVWGESSDAKVAGVLDEESTEIEFGSILDMVNFFNACLERGAFYVDGGWLAMDPEMCSLIHDEIFGGLYN